MIKVMNVISDSNIGGAGRVLINYLKYWDKEQFEISVALPQGSLLKASLEELGATVYEVDIAPDKSYDRGAVKTLRELIHRVNPDLVHTHGSLSGRVAGRRCGKKVIFTRHSVFPVSPNIKKGPGRLVNKLLNEHYADRIIAVSPAAKENLTDGGIDPRRIAVIMNGVEPVPRCEEPIRGRTRAQYGVNEGDFVLGIVARIEDYKGHMILLDAVKKLRDQGRQLKVLVAGTGAYEQQVNAYCKQLALEDTVRFLGFVTQVPELLSILDVQINASYGTEATSLSLLEGMSMGLPAIVSDYGGNPWLIREGRNGLVFPSKNSGALAACIARLMDEPALREGMHQQSKDLFLEQFTGEMFAKKIEAVYLAALKGES